MILILDDGTKAEADYFSELDFIPVTGWMPSYDGKRIVGVQLTTEDLWHNMVRGHINFQGNGGLCIHENT